MQDGIVKDLGAIQRRFIEINSPRNLQDLITQVKNLRISSLEKTHLEKTERVLLDFHTTRDKFQREKAILDSLTFEAMFDRYHAIAEAHRTTFDWIFQPKHFPLSDPRSSIAFKEWLLSGTGVFWVSGKPGSGKSTLMRYLWDCSNTKQYLKLWAGNTNLVTASFYFWMAGTQLQRSQRGLLRQLLFEILREHPDLIPHVCPHRWNSTSYNSSTDWSLGQLRDTLNRLGGISASTKICFFLDGLDEYDGDHFELVETLDTISKIPNIKMCVSSRRWPIFQDAYGARPDHKLYLEDLTRDDIKRFTQDKLEESPQLREIKSDQVMYTNLVEEITRKAQGVFLWVFLVVRSLRSGLSNGDSATLLRQRLEEIPSDLEKFFEKIIDSVDPFYQQQMAAVFQVALRAPHPINLVTLWLMDEPSEYILGASASNITNRKDVFQVEEVMSRRLHGRYKGLLEGGGEFGKRKAYFLHRTVRDYLQTKKGVDLFALPGLNPLSKACRAFLAYMAMYGSRNIDKHATLEHFVIFARWAEIQNEPLDFELVDEMSRIAFNSSRTSIGSEFLTVAVQYGFCSSLQYLLPRYPEDIQINGEEMMQLALQPQALRARKLFGIQSATSTLTWLVQNVAGASTGIDIDTFFLDLLFKKGQKIIDDEDMEQRLHSLGVLLRHGADVNSAALGFRLTADLPWIGSDMQRTFPNMNCKYFTDLAKVYAILLEHGLDPNKLVGNSSIWRLWLWYICEVQISHGLYENPCSEAIKSFLRYGANPYEEVDFQSDRLDELFDKTSVGHAGQATYFRAHPRKASSLSVSFVVGGFFGLNSRNVLEPVLEDAKVRWGDKESSTQTCRLGRTRGRYEEEDMDSQPHVDTRRHRSKRRRV